MDRVTNIFEHPLYQQEFRALQAAEQDRPFCNHTLEHFLDVALLAYIMNLEQALGLDKSVIYAAALLHDIGRNKQLTEGTPHDEASAELAGRILPDCDFSAEETEAIQAAILAHRGDAKDEPTLVGLISKADKLSRNCFTCKAYDDCYWSEEKKNHKIVL